MFDYHFPPSKGQVKKRIPPVSGPMDFCGKPMAKKMSANTIPMPTMASIRRGFDWILIKTSFNQFSRTFKDGTSYFTLNTLLGERYTYGTSEPLFDFGDA